MAGRVTLKDLNYMLEIMGELMGLPVKGEMNTSGKARALNPYKRDFLGISQSYGGYMPVIVRKSSAESTIGLYGLQSHVPASECYNWMRAFITGYEMAKIPKSRW